LLISKTGTLGPGHRTIGFCSRPTSEPSELNTTRFGSGECGLRPRGDHAGLVLRDSSQDVNGEPVRLREVHCYKIHPALHRVEDEGDVAGQAIELRDDQGRSVSSTEIESALELGPVIAPAALDLENLSDDATVTRQVTRDGRALRVETEAATPLPIRRDAQIVNPALGPRCRSAA
jgi:hypothetical protein